MYELIYEFLNKNHPKRLHRGSVQLPITIILAAHWLTDAPTADKEGLLVIRVTDKIKQRFAKRHELH